MPWYRVVGKDKHKLASANIGHKVRNLVATDPAAWAAFKALEPHGNVYAVGGIVRDVVLGKIPNDVDLMVQGIPSEKIQDILEGLPGRIDHTGNSFGIFRYKDPDGNEVEIALPRSERSTGPGHKDFEVYTDPYLSVGQDLARRDFTGNAMAVNLSSGDLVDPYHGSEDLKRGELQTVSDQSLVEDPLRTMRALAMVARHQLDPTPELFTQLQKNAPNLKDLPQERIQKELDKIFEGDDPVRAIKLAIDTGILHEIMPEMVKTIHFDQNNPHHDLPLHEHLQQVLGYLTSVSDDKDLRLMGFLHDVGKPDSEWKDADGISHYYQNEQGEGKNHESIGAEQAREIMERLRYPQARIDRVTHLIQHHMFPEFSSMSGARKFINRVGDEHTNDLLSFRDADHSGKPGASPSSALMGQYVDRVREANEPTTKADLAINGNDLISAGIPQGKQIGQIFEYLTNAVLEDPSLNNRETLLQLAQGQRTSSHKGDDYIDELATRIKAECSENEIPEDRSQELFRLYALLALTKGKDTTAEDVHDAWSTWKVSEDPYHKSLIPFDELTKEVQEMDEPYVKYIHKNSNILDPIQDGLDPDVFHRAEDADPDVKASIVSFIRDTVYTILTDAGWPDPKNYLKLILTGSLTTYQWSPESDADISLWIDTERLPDWVRADLIALMIEKAEGKIVPGTTHPLQAFVVNTNKYKEYSDLYKPGLRSAYDLDERRWIVLPEKNRSQNVYELWPQYIAYSQQMEDKIRVLLKYNHYALKILWDRLHHKRFRDMQKGLGDFSQSNIVYKWLNNKGLFDQISQATGEHIAKAEDWMKTNPNSRPYSELLKRSPELDSPEFEEYVIRNNKADRDSGELNDIGDTEIRRLAEEYHSEDSSLQSWKDYFKAKRDGDEEDYEWKDDKWVKKSGWIDV